MYFDPAFNRIGIIASLHPVFPPWLRKKSSLWDSKYYCNGAKDRIFRALDNITTDSPKCNHKKRPRDEDTIPVSDEDCYIVADPEPKVKIVLWLTKSEVNILESLVRGLTSESDISDEDMIEPVEVMEDICVDRS